MASTCNCIKEIEKRLVKNYNAAGNKALKAEMQNTAFMISSGETKTAQVVEVTISSKKKPEIVNLLHSFCPFCGTGYLKEKEVSRG